MKMEQLTLPYDINDPEQKLQLGKEIGQVKRGGIKFELRPESNAKHLVSLWRDAKGWNQLKSEGKNYKSTQK